MSVNTAHASNGVLIHAGEYILLHSDCISMEFSGQDNSVFKGSKQGRIYLTSHRMIFNHKKPDDLMQSFSAPFIAMSDVELEQPVFGSNYIKGKVRAQPNGNFIGEVKFKLYFKAGGAIEYGTALLRAASTAQSNMRNGNFSDNPPPYTPSGAWHEAPPPAYQPPPGYYGWLPTHDAFTGPAPNTVFISDNPPPYPGINGPPAYAPPPQQQQQQQYPQYQPPPSEQPAQQSNDMPSWNGFSAPPPEPTQQQQSQWGGHPQMPPQQQAWGYQPQPQWGQARPQFDGYMMPDQQQPGYPNFPGCPPQGQQPQGVGFGYPPPGGAPSGAAASAMGFNARPNSKEAEAVASGLSSINYAPNNYNHGMPPSYNDLPPSYQEWNRKNN